MHQLWSLPCVKIMTGDTGTGSSNLQTYACCPCSLGVLLQHLDILQSLDLDPWGLEEEQAQECQPELEGLMIRRLSHASKVV